MKVVLGISAAALALGLAVAAHAQTTATTSPSGTATAAAVTATCKDGSDFSGTTRSGACRGHGGVKAWTSTPAASASTASTSPTAPTAPNSAVQKAVPPGGSGQVWVNTASKVYHCPGDRYYGKTKAGTYMTESAAKAAGDHPDHGKVCSSS